MQIKEGLVKLEQPTREINIYVEREKGLGRTKALIVEAKQDSLQRLYLTVR